MVDGQEENAFPLEKVKTNDPHLKGISLHGITKLATGGKHTFYFGLQRKMKTHIGHVCNMTET